MSSPQFDVIVGGSLHLDIMVSSPLLPRVDETAMGSEWGMKCGGKGGNQAVMAAKTGVKVAMIGQIGDDDFGRRLVTHLDFAKVDRRAIHVDHGHGSGMSVAIVQDDGEYGAVVVSGANNFILPERMSEAWEKLGGGRVLILQNEIPEAANLALAQAAKVSNAKILLNAAPYRTMQTTLLELVDCLVLNRIEASEFLELEITTVDDAVMAFRTSHARFEACEFRGTCIVTLGAKGLVVGGPNLNPIAIAPRPVKSVSAHGAGDCFVGVLAAALAKGAPLFSAAEKANETAAAYVATPEKARSELIFDSVLGRLTTVEGADPS